MEGMEGSSQEAALASQLRTIMQTGAAIKRWTKLARNSRDRYLRLNQLITTEAQYCSDLKSINQKMQIPLKECEAISQYEQKEMFPNIEGMIQLSEQLHTDMGLIFSTWQRQATMIGQTMIKFSRFMLVYADFFKNYENTSRKLKLLVQNNEIVKEIEKQLNQQPRGQTFLNLLSKPFQRALKYHLILKDYYKATPKGHPDFQHLEQAIECYHSVNKRNNLAMESKEKNQKLIQLDNVFEDVIGSDARYFITQSQAMILEMKVKCYVLSDRVLISEIDGSQEREYIRIAINNNSFVTRMKDGVNIKNGMLFCGRKHCIHLTFKSAEERDRLVTYLFGVIQEIYNNENFKEGIRMTRKTNVSYMEESLKSRGMSLNMEIVESRSTAESMESFQVEQEEPRQGSGRTSQEVAKVESMLPRSPRIVVLGPIKRYYSSTYSKIYYLTKVQLPFPSDCHQILYIPEENMLMIQKMSKIVYYQHRDYINAPLLEQLLKLMQCASELKTQDYKALYFTLLLNTIFRHSQISKRLDIFAHMMEISEGFWLSLKYPNIECKCQYCYEGRILNDIERYNSELEARIKYRTLDKTFFCPFRTFHVQESILTIPTSEIQLGIDRLFRVKCEKGYLEYRLLDNPPLDESPSKEVIFNISYGLLPMKYEKHIKKQDRVGQIKYSFSKQLNIDLSEYQLCLEVNGNNYILGDDQLLFNVLQNEQESPTGIGNFFKSTFGTVEDTSIKLFIKRIWWFVHSQIDLNYLQKHDLRLDFFIEALAGRIKQQEIQLNIKDTITFYACYLLYKGEQHITDPILECLVPPRKWKLLSSAVKNDMLRTVTERCDKLREAFVSSQGSVCKKSIFSFMMKILRDRPIWGVFLFEGTYIGEDKQRPVRIGFDFQTFMIKQPEKVTNLYEQRLTEIMSKLEVSGWQLRVKDKNKKQYLVLGTQFEQMFKLLELYVQLVKTFGPQQMSV